MNKFIRLALSTLTFFVVTVVNASEKIIIDSSDEQLPDSVVTTSSEADNALLQMKAAWEKGRDAGKPVMVVLGAEWCDRCALLNVYMQDISMRSRIDEQFIVVNVDVGSPDGNLQVENSVRLPAIVLVDSSVDFEIILQSDQLITFLPEQHEPLFQWMENILAFTKETLAMR